MKGTGEDGEPSGVEEVYGVREIEGRGHFRDKGSNVGICGRSDGTRRFQDDRNNLFVANVSVFRDFLSFFEFCGWIEGKCLICDG